MISSNLQNPMIADILQELSAEGLCDLSPTLSRLFNELMKVEREHALKAKPYERAETRQGYANGYKDKTLQTRFGALELQVPQTRDSSFYPSCLERGERSEVALKLAIAEMYINGVSTRRVKKITEELCGFEISSTQVSRVSKLLDEDLSSFRERKLGSFSYVYFDARYEKVRHDGQVIDLAVLIAVGVNDEGYREVLGVSVDLSEAEVHWRSFFESLQQRGLHGLKLAISDSHSGLKAALKAVFPSVPWQRCIFHMAQNAGSYAPSQSMRKELAQALRDIYNALSKEEAMVRCQEQIEKYKAKASKFSHWLEENIEEGLAFFQFPRNHWKKIRTVNGLERLNQEIKRRTRVARIFPNEASCLRLVSAILVQQHEEWISNRRYFDFNEE